MQPTPGPIRDWVKAPNGDRYFADELHHRILVEACNGSLRVAPGEFRYPCAIAVLGSMAYVADSWNHRVAAFHLPEWKPAFEFGGLFCPSSIAVSGNRLVVADTNNRQLSFHAPDGSRKFTYALGGFPKRVAVDPDGFLVVHYSDGGSETLSY